METTQTPAQEQPVQPIVPEASRPQSQSESQIPAAPQPNYEVPAAASQPASETLTALPQEPSAPGQVPLYDPAKAARIAECLRELLDPAYIVLFGTLAGGTPHSDTFTYDLLVVTDEKSPYDWCDAKRYLKMKLPYVGHGTPYVNICVLTRYEVAVNFTPFVYLARAEGIVLYRSHRQKFRRPRRTYDFGLAAAAARQYADAFLPLADRLLCAVGPQNDRDGIRLAAFATAQGAVCYFRTLFYVYHGFEADTCDVQILQHRLRTLSGELILLLEGGQAESLHTLACLNGFRASALTDPAFFIRPAELLLHVERVQRFGEVVHRLCADRIALYDQRAE